MKTVITFGTFDVFHVGHLKILQRAKKLGDQLIVGVSTDELTFQKKKRYPVYTETERCEIIGSIKCVDHVFLEECLEMKGQYIEQFEAKVLVMGDDWKGKFDTHSKQCKVVYLERTPAVSTTQIIEKIRI